MFPICTVGVPRLERRFCSDYGEYSVIDIVIAHCSFQPTMELLGLPRLTQLTKSRRPLHDYDHTPAFLELIPLPLGARFVGACGGIVNGAVTSGSGGCEVKAGGCSDSLSVTCRGCGVVDVEVGAVGAEADAIEAFHMAIPMFTTWLLYMHESFHELIITPALLHRFMMRHNGHFCGVFANPRTSSGRFSLSDTSNSRSPMDAAHAAMRLVARD